MEVGFQRQDGEVILKQKRQKKRKARTISPHWFPLVAQRVKRLLALWETWVRSLGQEDPLEIEMSTHSSTLAWKIPWTEKPGRLQSIRSLGVRHD